MLYPAELRGRDSYNTRSKTRRLVECLVRPCANAAVSEVVRIGFQNRPARLWVLEDVGAAVALSVSDGLFFRVERELDLLPRVLLAGPPHQWVDRAGQPRLKLKHPLLGAGNARLHGGLRRLVDARNHVRSCSPNRETVLAPGTYAVRADTSMLLDRDRRPRCCRGN